MANTVGRFTFVLLGDDESGSSDISIGPVIKICLKQWTTLDNGDPAISPNLMSEDDIDKYIKDLKEDLEAVRDSAKREFQRANRKL